MKGIARRLSCAEKRAASKESRDSEKDNEHKTFCTAVLGSRSSLLLKGAWWVRNTTAPRWTTPGRTKS